MDKLSDLVEIADNAISSGVYDLKVKVGDILAIEQAFRELEQRAEAAEALNKHMELAVRKAEGVSEALRRKSEAAEAKLAENEKSSGFWGRAAASETIRANKAGAKLAELAKQEPVKWPAIPFTFDQLKGMHGKDFARGFNAGWLRKCASVEMMGDLYTRPAPAADLADLVPPEADGSNLPLAAYGWNACRAAILRKIEDKKNV